VPRCTSETEKLARAVTEYTLDRMRMDPPLDGSHPPEELARPAGQTITREDMGAETALALWDQVLSTACLSMDHPRYLAFIPSAPTEAVFLFDVVVGASSVYGGPCLAARLSRSS